MLDLARPSPADRILRYLDLTFDLQLCDELVRLYMRANQPITAWKHIDRLHRDLGYHDLRDLKAKIERAARLTLISHAEYAENIERLRGIRRVIGGKVQVRGDLVELPRGERKRASIFYFIWSVLDIGARYTDADLRWLITAALEDLNLISDYCHIRRYMLSAHMLCRTADGVTYWANPESPVIVLSRSVAA